MLHLICCDLHVALFLLQSYIFIMCDTSYMLHNTSLHHTCYIIHGIYFIYHGLWIGTTEHRSMLFSNSLLINPKFCSVRNFIWFLFMLENRETIIIPMWDWWLCIWTLLQMLFVIFIWPSWWWVFGFNGQLPELLPLNCFGFLKNKVLYLEFGSELCAVFNTLSD